MTKICASNTLMVQCISLSMLLSLTLLSACASHQIIKANAKPAIKAQREIPENELLDVGVAIFDPGIPDDPKVAEKKNIFPEVRKAEARYIPYILRTTLEGTGHWGAARVIPSDINTADLLVEGKVVTSNGEKLIVDILVKDATGRVWLEKQYSDTASKYAYRDEKLGDEDPFQDLHNNIANDMLEVKNRLLSEDIRTIRNVSELKFAADLSPHAFGDHLQQNERGDYTINRLPAQDDPMFARVLSIRDRDYMLIDTLDEHYATLYRNMAQPYQDWRENSFEEVQALREVQSSARNRMLLGAAAVIAGIFGAAQSNSSVGSTAGTVAMLGGIGVFQSGLRTRQESKIHAEALKELGNSFEAEVAPLVVDVEGKAITLTGSAEDQYKEWRRLLREIYATETGLPLADESSKENSEANLEPKPDQ